MLSALQKLFVYHGTHYVFEQVDLTYSKDRRDFGRGFYTTTIASQAESWARNVRMRAGVQSAYVYEYELLFTTALSVKVFEGLTIEWLDFIRDNRSKGGIQHAYDVVIGPVANDNTLLTVTRYIQGVYDAEEAIRRLAYFKVNDQVSLHTQRAVDCLRLARRYSVD